MEIKIPEVGESVHEALVAQWLKNSGDVVNKDQPLCEIETDKITLELNAEVSGVLSIQVAQGTTVAVGTVIGEITEQLRPYQPPVSVSLAESAPLQLDRALKSSVSSPSARREMRASGVRPEDVMATGKGGRIMPDDVIGQAQEKPSLKPESGLPFLSDVAITSTSVVESVIESESTELIDSISPSPVGVIAPHSTDRTEERTPMTPIRRKIAERLLVARQQTAMLTTFNEADLTQINHLREKYRDHF
jgi:2-oxoglutarate dehydrogenase E2 component (dihydrolipoamide succinyltransferase)